MATTNSPRNQIPLKFDLLGKDNKVTQPWAFFLQTLQDNLPPSTGGAGFVIDGTASITGPTTLDQGPSIDKGSNPVANSIFFAQDTGQIFTVQGGQWQLQSPALTGDISKPAFGSVTTLATVNANIGTYGNATSIPRITVDNKGRVTGITTDKIVFPEPVLPGIANAILFDVGGQIYESPILTYDHTTEIFATANIAVANEITFTNAVPTFNNLSPLANIGDILTHDATTNTVLPVGADSYVLTANASASSGLSWEPAPSSVQAFVEVSFNYGDASPKPLTTVPAGKQVLLSSIVINTPMNGVGANLTIGSASVSDDIMTADDSNVSVQSNWGSNPNTVYSTDTMVYLTINNGSGATAGSGLVILQIQN